MTHGDLILLGAAASGLALAGVTAATYAVVSPHAQMFGPLIDAAPPQPAGSGRAPEIALTFDDGPWPESTGPTLDVLKRNKVSATFFVIGQRVAEHPEFVRRIVDEGHIVANHSWNHFHHGWRRGSAFWRDELGWTNEAIEMACGQAPAWFRPPLGFKAPMLMRTCAVEGYSVITWTRRAFDGVPTTAAQIVGRLGTKAQAGEILCLHDGMDPHSTKRRPAETVAALEQLLPLWRERGLRAVRLDHLIGLNPYRG